MKKIFLTLAFTCAASFCQAGIVLDMISDELDIAYAEAQDGENLPSSDFEEKNIKGKEYYMYPKEVAKFTQRADTTSGNCIRALYNSFVIEVELDPDTYGKLNYYMPAGKGKWKLSHSLPSYTIVTFSDKPCICNTFPHHKVYTSIEPPSQVIYFPARISNKK
jgi:hypothetical protein